MNRRDNSGGAVTFVGLVAKGFSQPEDFDRTPLQSLHNISFRVTPGFRRRSNTVFCFQLLHRKNRVHNRRRLVSSLPFSRNSPSDDMRFKKGVQPRRGRALLCHGHVGLFPLVEGDAWPKNPHSNRGWSPLPTETKLI